MKSGAQGARKRQQRRRQAAAAGGGGGEQCSAARGPLGLQRCSPSSTFLGTSTGAMVGWLVRSCRRTQR